MGMDNECADFFTQAKDNSDYVKFLDAVKQGLLSEKDIDISLKRFSPPASAGNVRSSRDGALCAICRIPRSIATPTAHSRCRAAQESIVLLKNDGVASVQFQT